MKQSELFFPFVADVKRPPAQHSTLPCGAIERNESFMRIIVHTAVWAAKDEFALQLAGWKEGSIP